MIKSSLEKAALDLEEDWLKKGRERKTAGVKKKGASAQGWKKTLKLSPLCPQSGMCNRRLGPWLGGRGAQFRREKMNRFFSLLNCLLSPCESRKVIEQEWVIILFRSLSIQHKSVFALGERAGSYLQGWMKLHSWLWLLLVILPSLQLPRVSIGGSTAAAGGGVPKEEEKGALMWQVFPNLLDSETLELGGGGMLLECDFGWGLPNFNSYLLWLDHSRKNCFHEYS